MEYAKHFVLYTCLSGSAGESFEFFRGLLAQIGPLLIGGKLFAKFLLACLNGEIFLRIGDFRFARVAILGD